MCKTMICRTHVHQSPHRTCSNCLLRLQDYLGGASYHNKIKGDVDEMPRSVPALFEAGHRQLSAYVRDVEINQVSLHTAQVDYVGGSSGFAGIMSARGKERLYFV